MINIIFILKIIKWQKVLMTQEKLPSEKEKKVLLKNLLTNIIKDRKNTWGKVDNF